MKFKSEQRDKHRIVRRFLCFPTTLPLQGTKIYQTRWMEWAEIEEIYFEESGIGWAKHAWVD